MKKLILSLILSTVIVSSCLANGGARVRQRTVVRSRGFAPAASFNVHAQAAFVPAYSYGAAAFAVPVQTYAPVYQQQFIPVQAAPVYQQQFAPARAVGGCNALFGY